MSKCNLEPLVLKHSTEISELKSSTATMLMLWKIVGYVSLAALTVWLTSQFGGSA